MKRFYQDLDRRRALCEALEGDDFQPLRGITDIKEFPAKAQVFREGDQVDYIYNVKSGLVKLYRVNDDGETHTIGLAYPTDFIGLAFFDRYPCYAATLTDTTLCRMNATAFREVVQGHLALQKHLYDINSQQLLAAQDHIFLIGRSSARQRVARFILMLASRMRPEIAVTKVLHLPMTRTEIADYLCLTLETVSRKLAEFEKDGIIGRERGRIEIKNIEGLQRLAH